MQNNNTASIDPLVAEYNSYMQNSGFSKSTISSYTLDIMHFMNWYKEEYGSIFDISKYDEYITDRYQIYLKSEKNLADNTVKHKLSCINNYMVYTATKENLPLLNKAKYRGETLQDESVEIIEPVMLNKLLNYMENNALKRDLALFSLVLNTDIMLTDLCELEKEDIFIKNGITIIMTKNGNHVLNVKTEQRLKIYLQERQNDSSPYVFIGKNSKRKMSRIAIFNIIKSYEDKLGIPMNYIILNNTFLSACAEVLRVNSIKGIQAIVKVMNKDPENAQLFFNKLYLSLLRKEYSSVNI